MANLRSNAILIVILIIVANVSAQMIVFRHALNNEVMRAGAKKNTEVDAAEYVGLARGLAAGEHFGSVFRDARRPPGYPYFLALFMRFFGQPLLAVRVVQIILSANVILLSFLAVRRITSFPEAGILAALLVGVWAPLYYYSPILIAEACCIFMVSVLLCLAAWIEPWNYAAAAVLCGIAVAALTYLRPNLVTLLCLPIVAAFKVLPSRRQVILFGCISGLSAAMMILPWELFISGRFGHFPAPLSTLQGENLYGGAGFVTPIQANLGDIAARRFGFYDPALEAELGARASLLPQVQRNNFYQHLAFQRWRAQPVPLIVFGLCKVLHSFGFSLHAWYQYLTALFTVISFAASVFLWRWRKYREWVVVFWVSALVSSAQSFCFTAEIRYKVVDVDLPALFVCALFVFEGAQRFLHLSWKSISQGIPRQTAASSTVTQKLSTIILTPSQIPCCWPNQTPHSL